MSHELKLLTQKLYNKPHLMEAKSFESIVNYLSERNKGQMIDLNQEGDDREEASAFYNPDTKVGLISIDGPLTYKPVTVMGFDCGGASYEGIKGQMDDLVDKGMKTLVLEVDSGGGEAYQMMQTGEYLRSQADANGIKILAYVDGLSASAAYGLTAVADEIILNPDAEVGSIGVVVRLMNDSKALEKAGYERTFIYAGGSKVPFAEDGSFREDFLSDIQGKVNTLYEGFTEYVAKHRNISVEAVRSTEAKTFLPKKALEIGLADDVMTLEEFYSHLADVAQDGNSGMRSKLFNMKTKTNSEAEMQELELAQAKLAEMQTQFEAKEVELSAALAQTFELKEKLEASEAVVAQFKAEKESAELAAKEAVMKARMDKLTAAVGAEQASVIAAALEGVPEAQAEVLVGGYIKSAKTVEESALFTEMGADVEVETDPAMEDALASMINKKYKAK